MTWVKICGTTNEYDAQLSVASGANALGFVFAPSPRRIEPKLAAEITSGLPFQVERIGVFVNESPERVAQIADEVGLTGIQLHGDEPPQQMQDFRRALEARKIIKAVQAQDLLRSPKDFEDYLRAESEIDAILLDSGSREVRGGTGAKFPWQEAVAIAREIQAVMPLIIAGGLNGANVGEAIRLFAPFGVDVASGVESETGKKDAAKLREFVTAARQAEKTTVGN